MLGMFSAKKKKKTAKLCAGRITVKVFTPFFFKSFDAKCVMLMETSADSVPFSHQYNSGTTEDVFFLVL